MAGSRLITSLLWLLLTVLFSVITLTNGNLQSFCKDKRSLPPTVYHTLRELNICAVKPTRRGHRSWAKQHKKLIPVLTSSHRNKRTNSLNKTHHNTANLVTISPQPHCCTLRFVLWNARSLKRKTTSICDLIISQDIDICATTETWLCGDDRDGYPLADLSNTLPNFQVHHVPRLNRAGWWGSTGLPQNEFSRPSERITSFQFV